MSVTPIDKANSVPTRLRAAREAAGLSQGQVAKMMGMHRPTISRWKREIAASRRGTR